jgi:hypothetical protein
MSRRNVLALGLLVAVVAVVFPPWGFMGEDFDHFGFALRRDPRMTGEYSSLRASIAWHLLALELGAIALVTAIAVVLMPKR